MIAALWMAALALAQDAHTLLASGQEKLKAKSYDAAIADFEACLAKDAAQFNAHFGLGVCRWEKDEIRAARTHFGKVVELVERKSPEAALPRVYQQLLACDLLLEDFDRAIEDASYLLKLQATGEYYFDRALAQQRKGDWAEAINDGRKALVESPNLIKARVLRGQVYLLKGDPEWARHEFEEAVKSAPESWEAHAGLGTGDYFLQRPSTARESLEQSRRLNRGITRSLDDDAYCASLLWLLATRRGDPQEASRAAASVEALLQADRIDGSRNRYVRILRYLSGGLSESALLEAAGKVASSRKQAQCEACFFIGEKKLLEGDKAGARDAFRRVLAAEAVGCLEHDAAR